MPAESVIPSRLLPLTVANQEARVKRPGGPELVRMTQRNPAPVWTRGDLLFRLGGSNLEGFWGLAASGSGSPAASAAPRGVPLTAAGSGG